MNQCNDIINKVLESEEYVHIEPSLKNSFEFRISHLIKEEIRSHRWNIGTEGRNLTWIEAKNEWMTLYYDAFLKGLKSSLSSKKKKNISKEISGGYSRRDPVVTGGIL